MPYHVGEKGSYGCSGFPALKDGTNEVMGCHATSAEAAAQIYAINRSEGNIGKAATSLVEGDFAMTEHGGEGDFHVGQVVHVMYEGMLGNTGTEYALQATPENPAVLIQLFEQEEDGTWEATRLYSACSMGLMVKIPPLKMENEEMDSETMMAMYDSSIGKSEMANAPYEDAEEMDKEYQGCGCPTCKELNVDCPNCPVCQADMNKSYYSDNEEIDKWDNMTKACWVGYEQQGMKEKDGRMVPNCVPVGKTYNMDDEMEKAKKPNYSEIIEPRRGGSDPADPRLYARVVQAAKDKFDVYPSAVANSWVVGEYKRRGGTYKGEDMNKRDYSMDARRDMAASGMAMPDGSFPIANGGDLQNAIQSVGRASNYAAAKEHIVRRARALGMMDMLPEDWRNNATKGMGQWSGSIFDLNPFVK